MIEIPRTPTGFACACWGFRPLPTNCNTIDLARIQAARHRQVEVLADEPLIASFDVSGGGAAWNVIRFRRGL